MAHKYGPPSPEIALVAKGLADALRQQGEGWTDIAASIAATYGWELTRQAVMKWFGPDGKLIPVGIEKPMSAIERVPADPLNGYRRITAETLDLNTEVKAAVANAFEAIDFIFAYARGHGGEMRANFTQYAVPHMNAVARLLASIPKDETKGKEEQDDPMREYLAGFEREGDE